MEQATALAAPMMGRSQTNDDPYRPADPGEEELESKPYLAAVGALIYLATHTQPDISFATSVLAQHNHHPTARHWQGIKHLLRYLRGTTDLGLHFRCSASTDITRHPQTSTDITRCSASTDRLHFSSKWRPDLLAVH